MSFRKWRPRGRRVSVRRPRAPNPRLRGAEGYAPGPDSVGEGVPEDALAVLPAAGVEVVVVAGAARVRVHRRAVGPAHRPVGVAELHHRGVLAAEAVPLRA